MSPRLRDPADPAGEAADIALGAAKIAQKEAKKAAAAEKEITTRFPTEHELMVRALASHEQSGLLRIGPRRHRWKDLLAFEEQLAGLEQRRAATLEEISSLNLQLKDEPARYTAALARWMEEGEKGERPVSRVAELQAAVTDRRAEYDADGLRYDQVLQARSEHVVSNRARFVNDVRKAKEKAAAKYASLIDAIEAQRIELLDLRSTEVWCGLFPSEFLQNEPNTQALVGANKRVQKPLLPDVEAGILATPLFELLRADVRFCSEVGTLDQVAALNGKTAAQMTGREARWEGDGKPDFVGPRFEGTWAGSPEEARENERIKRYAETVRRRLLGE